MIGSPSSSSIVGKVKVNGTPNYRVKSGILSFIFGGVLKTSTLKENSNDNWLSLTSPLIVKIPRSVAGRVGLMTKVLKRLLKVMNYGI